jgi:anaerobic selenocysteine-containing dehydrogenase
MQRHVNGGANVRAIDAFVAMTGNIGIEGGGARYGHLQTWGYNYHAMLQKPPVGSIGMEGAAGPVGEFVSGGKSQVFRSRAEYQPDRARDSGRQRAACPNAVGGL